jgi:CheY-like chemotaxis protein
MPDLDGFDVAGEIVQRPPLANATIMMLTSSGQYGDVARCRSLGIASCLTKPIRQADLHDAICRALGAGTPTAKPAGAPPPSGRARRTLRVLLADDNVVNQRVAEGLLTRRGHHVTVVSNGREALMALDREHFDLVLMDVQMPELGGFETTAAIRASERLTGGRIPILAMTAHALNGDRERCLAAGMDGYLSKPIEARALYAAVEEESVTRSS